MTTRSAAFCWGAALGALVYPTAQIVTRIILGRTLLHPDH